MKIARKLKLQELNLENLLKTSAFQFIDKNTPWFAYTSGQIGPYYVQSTTIEKDGEAYAIAIESIVEIVRADIKKFDAISGGETRDWDFSNPVAVALQKPHIKIYKTGKVLGSKIGGKQILHIADLNNEGSSMRDYWKPTIEKYHGKMIGILSFVDRLEDGFNLLKNLGLQVMSVVPLDEQAWNFAHKKEYISSALHQILVDRQKDRYQWAIHTLLNNPEYFRKMFYSPETKNQALKIMNTYSEIRKQLAQVIKN